VDPTDVDHPITRRIPSFNIEDELYILKGDSSRWTTLMTSNWRGKKEPMVYIREEEAGRICYLALGHGVEAFTNLEFQKLTIRAIRWATGFKEAPPVRCGIVGYGGAFNMGKAHANMISQLPGLEMVAVCDVDRTRTAVAKEDFPGIKTFTSFKKMLEMNDLDLVTLVTPHNIHAQQAVQAAQAGKHVVTEKPMCITAKQATDMVNAAKKSGTMISVFHNRRWDGDYKVLRKLLAAGTIGEVFQIDVFSGGYGHPGWWWRSDKKISGGCLYDWGAHFVDWILNLVPSPVDSVTGFYQKLEWHGVTNEDHTVAVIRFANGVMANVEQSHLAAAPKDRWRVLGTKGSISLGQGNDFWTVRSYLDGPCVESKVPFEKVDWLAYYRNIADHLIAGEELEVKGEQGRRVIAVIETAEKSSKQRKSLPVPYEK
jgi:predicted dehydrogenase